MRLRVVPKVGETYVPAPDVIPVSDGLPRTVTRIETRDNTWRYIVHYRTDDGEGFQSDNLWHQWCEMTKAKVDPDHGAEAW